MIFPLLSIIVPAYNAEVFLFRTISSILNQTQDEIEIIVVNDGSTDGTAAIAKQFGTQIRYVEQTNQGVSNARNTGLQIAEGEWISFLDADDFWLPEYWQVLKPVLRDESENSVVCFGWVYANESGEFVGRPVTPTEGVIPLEEIVASNRILSHSAVCRKEELFRIGGFDSELAYAEDWDVWMRLALSGSQFRRLPIPLVAYRLRSESLSKDLVSARAHGQLVIDKAFTSDQMPATMQNMHERVLGSFWAQMAVFELGRGNEQEAAEDLEKAFQLAPGLLTQEQTYFALASCKQPVYLWGSGIGIDLDYQYDLLSVLVDPYIKSSIDNEHDRQLAWTTFNMVFLKLAYFQESRSHMLRYLFREIYMNPAVLKNSAIYSWFYRIVFGKPRK